MVSNHLVNYSKTMLMKVFIETLLVGIDFEWSILELPTIKKINRIMLVLLGDSNLIFK